MPFAVAPLALGLLLATDASACREGRIAYPPEVGPENSALLQRADHIFVGRVSAPAKAGNRVHASIEPLRVVRGSANTIAFEDESLPSTCSAIASQRLGSLEDGMPVLVLRKDGLGGFSVLVGEGVLLMLDANDLLALIEPESGE